MVYSSQVGVIVPYIQKFKKQLIFAVAGLFIATIASMSLMASAATPSYSTFGDASIVADGNPGNAVELGNDDVGFGGVVFTDTGVVTLSDLNTLSTDCNFTEGEYGAGTPRFGASIENAASDSGTIFFYLNNTDCPQNDWDNTGNLASPTSIVEESALSGGTTETYAQAQSKYGDYTVTQLFIVSDTSFGPQTLLIDNTMVNEFTYTYGQPTPVAPNSKDECKNGGWKNSNSPSFKNQGQCVSHFASNGKSTNARNR